MYFPNHLICVKLYYQLYWIPVFCVCVFDKKIFFIMMLFKLFFIFLLLLLFLLYNIVLVLSYFNMYPPRVYPCSLDLLFVAFVIIIIHNGLPQRILPFCLTVKLYCSIDQLCPTVCDPTDCSMLVFPVLCQLLELAQTHVH